jgi:hypothetical protein
LPNAQVRPRSLETVESGVSAFSMDAAATAARSVHALHVTAPYRLDLTVSALRRLSTNIVDVLTPDGQDMWALPSRGGTSLRTI